MVHSSKKILAGRQRVFQGTEKEQVMILVGRREVFTAIQTRTSSKIGRKAEITGTKVLT